MKTIMTIMTIIVCISITNNLLASDTLKNYFSSWRENKLQRINYLNFFLNPKNQNTFFFTDYADVADILGIPNSERKKDYTYIILDDNGHQFAEILFVKKRKNIFWMVR